jgi:hypothetical protein
MMKTTHPLVDDYLRRLERAARVLPGCQRDELLAEIRNHLDAGLRPDASEAEVRNFLEDLGTPADIIDAAQPDRAPTRRGAREVFAVLLLLVGLPPILGWLVGVALLLWSPLWSARQKLLGILVWPGGLILWIAVAPAVALSRSGPHTSGPPAWAVVALLVVLVVSPILVASYLYRAAGRRAEAM